MAILSNINGKFAVDSTGAIQFSGSAGTSGYILRSNGNAAPTWVDVSTVIGGPYLPLTGGTLSGALAGTSATFSGTITSGGTIYSTLDSTFSTDGSISKNSVVGLIIRGVTGSVFDLALYGAGGTALMTNSTGTNNIVFNSGNVTVAGSVTTPQINLNSAGGGIIDNQTANIFIQTPAGGGWIFRNGAPGYSEKMRIDSSGNVSVGADTPLYLLGAQDIGQIAVNRVPSTGVITDTSRSAAYINLNASNGGSSLTFHTANANNLAPTQRLIIDSSGNVGVGNAGTFDNPNSYSKVIEIANSDAVGLILNDTRDTHPMSIANEGAVMNLRYNTTSLLSLEGATAKATFGGNVGIGVTSSTTKLQVNGDIGIGELNNTRSTNVRFAKNDVNVITFDISVAAIGAWRPGSCWIQVSGSQNGLQEYWSAWYFIRLTHYYLSGVAGQGTTNPSCILDSGGDTSQVIVGVSSTNSSNPQIITITLTDSGGTTNSMVADINCTMQVGINSIT